MEYRVAAPVLVEYCVKLFMKSGVPKHEAFVVAESLVGADLKGIESHGVSRMALYLERLNKGIVNPVSKLSILSEEKALLSLDANNSMGIVASFSAMKMTINKAMETGVCFTNVRNSNHNGMAAYYTEMAAQEQMIGISGTNAPPNIAPTGSSKPYLGTNPFAISTPSKHEPVTLDMAASTVAMGKVIMAAKLGQPIPLGWALDAEGRPTTDAELGRKGSVVPIGGPKGYGIAFFIEVLSGILSGTLYGPHLNNLYTDFSNPQRISHFFCAIDIAKLIRMDVYLDLLDNMISEIRELPRNEGVEKIFMPGEIEHNRKQKRLKEGIPLSEMVYLELENLGKPYNFHLQPISQ